MMDRRAITLRVLNAAADKPFSYGEVDCCLTPARIALAITGVDYAAHFNYSSEAEAQAILNRSGGVDGLFTELLGDPVDTDQLDYGDPVLIKHKGMADFIGVWFGGQAFAKMETGAMIPVNVKYIAHGWRLSCPV